MGRKWQNWIYVAGQPNDPQYFDFWYEICLWFWVSDRFCEPPLFISIFYFVISNILSVGVLTINNKCWQVVTTILSRPIIVQPYHSQFVPPRQSCDVPVIGITRYRWPGTRHSTKILVFPRSRFRGLEPQLGPHVSHPLIKILYSYYSCFHRTDFYTYYRANY